MGNLFSNRREVTGEELKSKIAKGDDRPRYERRKTKLKPVRRGPLMLEARDALLDSWLIAIRATQDLVTTVKTGLLYGSLFCLAVIACLSTVVLIAQFARVPPPPTSSKTVLLVYSALEVARRATVVMACATALWACFAVLAGLALWAAGKRLWKEYSAKSKARAIEATQLELSGGPQDRIDHVEHGADEHAEQEPEALPPARRSQRLLAKAK